MEMGDLSEHFNSTEFRCHDGSPLPDNFPETIKDTVEFLERLRGFMNFYIAKNTGVWLDLGIIIISGHRTLSYNRRIGSSDTSRHVTGQAADVKPVGGYKYFSYGDFYKMCAIVDKSFPGRPYRLGYYGRSKFVHIDCGYGHGSTRWTGN
jgi:hypothetical protein